MNTKNKILFSLFLISSIMFSEVKIHSSDMESGDNFGNQVETHKNWYVIASKLDDDNGLDSGSIYVYREFNSVLEEYKLSPSDGESGEYFGKSISIYNNWIAVGAVYDDENGVKSGSVYMFNFNGEDWVEYQKITAYDGSEYDRFSYALDLYDDILVVGSIFDDDFGNDSGSVYIYKLQSGYWNLHQKINSINQEEGDAFGISVSTNGINIAVGSKYSNLGGIDAGSVVIFNKINDEWIEVQNIVAFDSSDYDYFGSSVLLDESKLIVSSPYSDSSYSGYMLNAGSVYIYNIGNYFDFSIKILASDAYLNDYFGSSVSTYDQWIAVSSQRNDHGSNSGAVYLYQIEDNQILQELKVDSDNLEAYDQYGYSVALYKNKLIAGSIGDDGDDNVGHFSNSGAAYLYDYVGCSSFFACNYSATSLIQGECVYADYGFDCFDNCYLDIDECGVCGGPGINGDANSDLDINVADIVYLVDFIIGDLVYFPNQCIVDFNVDNILNVADIILLIELILEN
tara:strand:- start:5432 stop:6967 length:1536 start_codon:yes stop_codon:yes gene_type:complete